MFLTVHAAAGILIGEQTSSPWLAFFLGIASHLVLDMIPHGDENLVSNKNQKTRFYKYMVISALDTLGVIVLAFILWQKNKINLSLPQLAAIVGAVLPDYIWGLSEITHWNFTTVLTKKIFEWFHDFFKVRLTVAKGLVVQLIVLSGLLYLIIK